MDKQSNSTTAPFVSIGEAANSVLNKIATRRETAAQILDAVNVVTEARNLNEAVFLAVEGIQDRRIKNAIASLVDVISKRLEATEELLDKAREAHDA